MNTIVYYVLSAGAACPGGTCPQQVVATPVAQAAPAPVIIYQASPLAFPWIAPRPQVIYVR